MSYLICKECGGHYQLQPGESVDDFSECVCGGELELRNNLADYNAESRLEDSSSEFALKDSSPETDKLVFISTDICVATVTAIFAMICLSILFIGDELFNLGFSNPFFRIFSLLISVVVLAFVYGGIQDFFRVRGLYFSLPRKDSADEQVFFCHSCEKQYLIKKEQLKTSDKICLCGSNLVLMEEHETKLDLGFRARYYISLAIFGISFLMVYLIFKVFNADILAIGRSEIYLLIFVIFIISLLLALLISRAIRCLFAIKINL